MIPKLIKLDYSHFDKLAFSANLDIPDCDIKDNIKLAGELRQYDPGVGGQNAAFRFFFEVREALERSTQSTPQDLGKKPSSWGSGPVGTRVPIYKSLFIFLFIGGFLVKAACRKEDYCRKSL